MPKKKRVTSKQKTYFKLIPLDVVKMAILADESKSETASTKKVLTERKPEGSVRRS